MNTRIEFIIPDVKVKNDILKICYCVLAGVGTLCGASALRVSTCKVALDCREATKVITRLIDVDETTPNLEELLALDNMNLGQFCFLYGIGKEAINDKKVINLDDMNIDDFLKQMS